MNQAGAKPSSTGGPDAVSPIRHQHTMLQYEQLHAISMAVSGRAQAGTLDHESALKFCTSLLPQLLVELEIASRVEERLAAAIPDPELQPCEATICSSRWQAVAKGKAKKKTAPRKKKGAKHDRHAS